MKPHMSAKQWEDLLEVSKKFNHLKPAKPFSKNEMEIISNILDGFDIKSITPPKDKYHAKTSERHYS